MKQQMVFHIIQDIIAVMAGAAAPCAPGHSLQLPCGHLPGFTAPRIYNLVSYFLELGAIAIASEQAAFDGLRNYFYLQS
jgi:hypothetical protein